MLKGLAAWHPPVVQLTIASDTHDLNLFTLAGSPSTPTWVILTINSGVTVGTAAVPHALRTGGLPSRQLPEGREQRADLGRRRIGGAGGSSPSIGQHTPAANGRTAPTPSTSTSIWSSTTPTATSSAAAQAVAELFPLGVRFVRRWRGWGRRRASERHSAGRMAPGPTATARTVPPAIAGAATLAGADGVLETSTRRGGDGGLWGGGSPGETYTDPPSDFGVGGAMGRAVALNGHAVTWAGGEQPSQVRGAVA